MNRKTKEERGDTEKKGQERQGRREEGRKGRCRVRLKRRDCVEGDKKESA